jgi:hypothetical protein
MATQNLTTARFVLQSLLQEIEAFDRDIPVARNLRVGEVADALLAVLKNRQLLRLAMPASSPRRHRLPGSGRAAIAKQKSRVSRLA